MKNDQLFKNTVKLLCSQHREDANLAREMAKNNKDVVKKLSKLYSYCMVTTHEDDSEIHNLFGFDVFQFLENIQHLKILDLVRTISPASKLKRFIRTNNLFKEKKINDILDAEQGII